MELRDIFAVIGASVCLALIPFACGKALAADLPLTQTTDDTINLGCELATVGVGDEMCFIIDTLPVVELGCDVPDAQSIIRMDLPVTKGMTVNFRCYTKLGTTQSANSVDQKPVEGLALPPTVRE